MTIAVEPGVAMASRIGQADDADGNTSIQSARLPDSIDENTGHQSSHAANLDSPLPAQFPLASRPHDMAIATGSRRALFVQGASSDAEASATLSLSPSIDGRAKLRPMSHASVLTGPQDAPSMSFSSAHSSHSSNSTETIVPSSSVERTSPLRPNQQRSISSPHDVTTLSGLQLSRGSRQSIEEEDRLHGQEDPLSPRPLLLGGTDDDEAAGAFYEEHVVALHDFSSSNDTCLSFRAGQIIKVFNRDESGWWDGELDGERGWFPSNYVDEEGMAIGSPEPTQNLELASENTPSTSHATASPITRREEIMQTSSPTTGIRRRPLAPSFSDPYRRKSAHNSPHHGILEPIEHSIMLLQNAVRASRWAHFQPATACVISSVRSVLSATDCLTRESSTLKAHPILAKERKQVLSELSRLVTQSRRASATTVGELPVAQEMQSMLRHASNVLHNTKRFLAVATECGAQIQDTRASANDLQNETNPSERSDLDKTPTPGSVRSSYLTAQTSAVDGGWSVGHNSSSHTDESSSAGKFPSQGKTNLHTMITSQDNESLEREAVRERADSGARSVSTDGSNFRPLDPPRRGSNGTSASSEELNEGESTTYNRSQALERLKWAHEHLLSIVAAVVGHAHTHARTSHASSYAFLIDVTREAVDSVRSLLLVVEAVCESETLRQSASREVSILLETKDNLYEATTALVTAARVVTSRSSMEIAASGIAPGADTEDKEKTKLLASATALLRTGQECVGAVKMCLSKASDDMQLVMPRPSKAQVAKDARAEAQRLQEEAEEEDAVERSVQHGLALGRVVDGESNAEKKERHTLSFLGRKATSLNCLRQRYEQDAESADGQSHLVSPIIDDGSQFSDADESHERLRRPPIATAVTSGPAVFSNGGLSTTTIDSSGDTSDTSDVISRYHSRASQSTLHSLQSSRTDLTTDTSNVIPLTHVQTERVDDRQGDSAVNAPGASVMRESAMLKSRTGVQGAHSAQRSQSPQTAPPHGSTFVAQQDTMSSRKATTFHTSLEAGFMTPTYDPVDISYNSEGEVTGATLPALVERMTPHDSTVEASFSNAFFLCFRLFTTPTDLFEQLRRRYEIVPPEDVRENPEVLRKWLSHKAMPLRLRVLNVFKMWLELHWQHSTDRSILTPLSNFIAASVTHSLHRSGQRLAELVQKRLADSDHSTHKIAMQAGSARGPGSLKRVISTDKISMGGQGHGLIEVNSMYLPVAFPTMAKSSGSAPPAPILSKSLMAALRSTNANAEIASGPSILDFDPLELARQLTIMESKIFCSILPEELLGQEFSKSSSKSSSVHIKQMSSLTTEITGWITECILGEDDAKKRTQVVKHFVKLGDRLLSLKNFNALFAVQSALNASTILRLRKTWDGLPTKYRNLMEEQRCVIEHTRNFSAYRSRIRGAMPPAMPFVGLFLTDITFCVEGNADTRPSPLSRNKQLINFDKYCKLARIISELQRFQVPYNLVEVPEVQTYLSDTVFAHRAKKASGPEDLYRRSLWLEPRPQTQQRPAPQHQSMSTPSASLATVSNASGSDTASLSKTTVSARSERSGSGLDLFNWR